MILKNILKDLKTTNGYDYPKYIPVFKNTLYASEFLADFISFLLETREYKLTVKKFANKYKYMADFDYNTFYDEVKQELNCIILDKCWDYIPVDKVKDNYILSFMCYISIYETSLKRSLMKNHMKVSIPIYLIEEIDTIKNNILKNSNDTEIVDYIISQKKAHPSDAHAYYTALNSFSCMDSLDAVFAD
jgi:hypothetical protein